jgi:thiamine-phosphate pyrophosphorylase
VKLPNPPLLLVTDRSQARGNILDIAEAAFAAGCRWVSLREKDLPAAEQMKLLRELLVRAKPFGATVTLHGDPELARVANIDGVHLSGGSDAANARRILGAGALVGLSVHSAEEARNVDSVAVDYVIAGPVFLTESKPGYGPALGTKGLAEIVKSSPVPVIAIGGIGVDTVADVMRAGASGVAVMGGIMRADDPAAQIKTFLSAISAAAPEAQFIADGDTSWPR